MADDLQLLRRYAETRANDAFAAVVEQHVSLVYSAALRQLGGAVHRAEEVTQSVFIDLARQAVTVARRDDMVGWLYTSTHYAAAKLKRAEARRQLREQEAHMMHEISSGTSESADWEQLHPVLDEAMHELDERDRQAILLRFFKDERFAEVGRRLGLSEDAARMRVERALDKLHTLLAKRGITSTSAALSALLANQVTATVPAGLAASVTATVLSAGSGTALSAFGVLQFMTSAKFVVTAATLLALLALGTAGYKVRVQRQAEASLATANRNQDLRLAKLRDLERRVQDAERRAADLKSSVASEARTTVDVEPSKPAAPWNPAAEGKAFLQRHPAVKQAYIEWVDSMITSLYADFWKSRGLTPTQIEQFRILQRSSWTYTRQITADKKQAPLKLDGPIGKDARDAAYRAILGDEGLRQYRALPSDFNASTTGLAREQVALVASGLCFSSTPLTPQQAEQLVQIIAESLRVGSLKRDWDAIDVKAKNVLSAAQLPAWEPFSALGRARRATLLARTPMVSQPDIK